MMACWWFEIHEKRLHAKVMAAYGFEFNIGGLGPKSRPSTRQAMTCSEVHFYVPNYSVSINDSGY